MWLASADAAPVISLAVFYIMVIKSFIDTRENEIRTFLNVENKCSIEICYNGDRNGDGSGWISLGKQDLNNFIDELKIIQKSMADGEKV